MQIIVNSFSQATSSKMFWLSAFILWMTFEASLQLSPAEIKANSVLVQAAQNDNKSLTCLTSSSTDYANRLTMATAMNISWVKTKDFSAIYAVEEEEGLASLKSNSFANVLDLSSLQISDQYYYICGIYYSNGTFELYGSFELFVTGKISFHAKYSMLNFRFCFKMAHFLFFLSGTPNASIYKRAIASWDRFYCH